MSMQNGRFVWYDLMTNDVEGAKRFYGEIAGWKVSKWEGGDYEMWLVGDAPIGGLMKLPAELAGVPPHWIGYVGVADVDATVAKAQQLGGKVLHPANDIPGVGRYAVLADPQGAAFALYASTMADEGEAPGRETPGQFSWAELNTTDWESAWRFYSQLFGWQPTSSMDMGPEMGAYYMFGTDSKQSMGGMSNAATMMKAPPHWLHYVTVPSADDAAKRVEQLGGKVLNGPMDVPGGDRIAQCMDPQGGFFAVYSAGPRG
ncbi:VOC family protein [Vulgatibacter sp.]|uniref:VOC family protein n=1 Tax=Vulgatibacter sp. TaxID=1971226 RepID=UPI0035641ADF